MITTYLIAKIIDTVYWALVTAPSLGFNFMSFYSNNKFYGLWILFAEIIIGGIIPAAILIKKDWRENSKLLILAIILGTLRCVY